MQHVAHHRGSGADVANRVFAGQADASGDAGAVEDDVEWCAAVFRSHCRQRLLGVRQIHSNCIVANSEQVGRDDIMQQLDRIAPDQPGRSGHAHALALVEEELCWVGLERATFPKYSHRTHSSANRNNRSAVASVLTLSYTFVLTFTPRFRETNRIGPRWSPTSRHARTRSAMLRSVISSHPSSIT